MCDSAVFLLTACLVNGVSKSCYSSHSLQMPGHIECVWWGWGREGDKQQFIATANLENFIFFKIGESRIFHSLEEKDSIFGRQVQWSYFSKSLYFLQINNCIEASIKQ